jgi:Lon protease-like protein
MALTRRLPMFPLESMLFPGEALPLHVFEQRYRQMTRECLAGDRMFGVVLIERGREVGGGDVRVDVGTTAIIREAVELPDGRFALICECLDRLQVVEWLPDNPYPLATVEVFKADDGGASPVSERLAAAEASVRRAWGLLSELGATSPPFPVAGQLAPTGPAPGVWQWCALAPLTSLDRLALLRIDSTEERLDLLCLLTDAVAEDARRLLATDGP